MADNARVARDFAAAWSRQDPDELANFFAEDAVWEDGVPSEPYRGKAAIREQLARYCRNIADVEIEVIHQVAQGNVVVQERVDRLTRKGKRLGLRAVCVFEFEGGKIKANRDYWNPGAYAPPRQASPP